MKTCSKCNEEKPKTSFFYDKKNKDGLQSQCKSCKCEGVKKYYNTIEGKQKRKDWEKATNRSLKRYYENRVSMNFSRRMRASISCGKDGRSWESLVGYTLNDLKKHLESKFVEGMTWENYGTDWHIDHIKPVVLFDMKSTDCSDFKECWSLLNIQPLFKYDNLLKGSRYHQND